MIRKSWSGIRAVTFAAALLLSVGISRLNAVPIADELQVTGRGQQNVVIDGSLKEWGDVPAVFLQQFYHRMSGVCSTGRSDAAIVSAMVDEEALYVAIRVVDARVHNSYPQSEIWRGDSVEVYFDLRPANTNLKAHVGSPEWSDGVYQLFIIPPVANGLKPAVKPGDQHVAAMGKFEVAGMLTEDGYALEMRFPYSSMAGASLDRFKVPFGFDVIINDEDRQADGLLAGLSCYGWGPLLDKYKAADAIRRCDSSKTVQLSNTSLFPPVQQMVERSSVIVAGRLSFEEPAKNKIPAPLCAVQLERGPYEGESRRICSRPKWPKGSQVTYAYPSFQRNFALWQQPLPTNAVQGRYTVSFKMGDIVFNKRFYGNKYNTLIALSEESVVWDAHALLSIYPMINLCLFPVENKSLPGTISLYMSASLEDEFSRRLSAKEKMPALRLVLHSEKGSNIVWSSDIALAGQQCPFKIPRAVLKQGNYKLSGHLFSEKGEDLGPLLFPDDYKGSNKEPYVLMVCVKPRQDTVLKTVLEKTTPRFLRAVKIGDPNRGVFPCTNRTDNYARSVWDLQEYKGRIYVGCGDWNMNRGPITIWSFDPATRSNSVEFTKEFVVQDESVDLFRVYGDTLYVPGTDPQESWEWGNLYTKRGGVWEKMRTIPNGLHTFDVAEWNGSFFVACGTESGGQIYRSEDSGQHWTACERAHPMARYQGRFWGLLPMGHELLIAGENMYGAFRLKDNKIQSAFTSLGFQSDVVYRLTSYRGGALYTVRFQAKKAPLLYLPSLSDEPQTIACFRDLCVQDIVVRDSVCHVLTAARCRSWRPRDTARFRGHVYRSEDLIHWKEEADFLVPLRPCSLEFSKGVYYVGLGILDVEHQWDAPKTGDPQGVESGTIWRLE